MGVFEIFNKPPKPERTRPSKRGSKLFRTSKPYGYHIPDVDNAIDQYNQTLSEMKAAIINYQNKINQLTSENKILKEELKKMHMEMSLMEVPEMSSAMEHTLLDGFEQITGKPRKEEPNPIQNMEEKDFSNITFDSFIPQNDSNNNSSSNNDQNDDLNGLFEIIQ